MGNETSKSAELRERPEYKFLRTGRGIDIGCGQHPINSWCDQWDKPQGNATFMEGVKDASYDWVYSSHCLEHIDLDIIAIKNWWRILKPGGYLLFTVPDWFLYEHKTWPSRFNRDHRNKYSIIPKEETVSVVSLLTSLPSCQVRWIRTNDKSFNYEDHVSDQTGGAAQAEIEVCAYKHPDAFWTD